MNNLSLEAQELLASWQFYREPISRPEWDLLYLEMCFKVAKRSHDAQTRCGAVFVNPDNEIIASGYNGFIREIDNTVLPNLRPLKYEFMLHAEHNAILNCARQGKSTKGSKAYITGEPCNNCLMLMIQAGVREIIYTNQNRAVMTKTDPKYKALQEILLHLVGDRLSIREVEIDTETVAKWRD